MKKILLTTLVVFLLSACSSDDDNPTKTIAINSGTENQIVYADDTEGKDGISFTATEAWMATVTEKTLASRASDISSSGVSWVRLLFNGTEKYSGSAGTFTLVIELEANYTGTSRSATIVIKSGNDSVTITITQEAKNKDGEKPIVSGYKYFVKQILETIYNEDGSIYEKIVISFDYNSQMQLVKVLVKVEDEPDEEIITISYENNKVKYNIYDECDKPHITTLTLNSKGYVTSGKRETEDVTWTVTYDEQDYMIRSYGIDKTDVTLVSEDSRELTWDNGNLMKVVWAWDNKNTAVTTATYTDIKNSPLVNLDLNWLIKISESWDFAVSSDSSYDTMIFAAMGYYGKGRSYLIKSTTTTGEYPESRVSSFNYKSDSQGLITQINIAGWAHHNIYDITYYE